MSERFTKRPVTIEAMQLDGQTVRVAEWLMSYGQAFRTRTHPTDSTKDAMVIVTLEGGMRAAPGDWIIRGVKGEFYPCKPDIFDATYMPAEDVEFIVSAITDDDLRAEAARRGMTVVDAEQARIERDARARIVKAVREHCTITDDEAMRRGGDHLIAAVADWIENPPEWVAL